MHAVKLKMNIKISNDVQTHRHCEEKHSSVYGLFLKDKRSTFTFYFAYFVHKIRTDLRGSWD